MSSTATYKFFGNDVDSEWAFPAFSGVPVVEVNGVAHAFTYDTPVGSYRIALTLDPGDPEAEPEPIPAEEPPTRDDEITVTIDLVADQGV